MVVFTCNHCGESVQKPKVEKHYQFKCRNSKFLTCVDCLKDFRNEEFVSHTKCITEDERYAAKGTFKNGIVKKGEVKQESWVEMIKSIIDKETNLAPKHRNLLNTISEYNNVPRKKNKFLNFIKSSSGNRVNLPDIEAVWDIIEKYKNETKANKMEENVLTNGSDKGQKRKVDDTGFEKPKLKKNKTKIKEEIDPITEDENQCLIDKNIGDDKFSFQQKILEVVQQKGTISLKKLEKKVINAYVKYMGETKDKDRIIKKINKKLKKVQGIKVAEDNVSLIES